MPFAARPEWEHHWQQAEREHRRALAVAREIAELPDDDGETFAQLSAEIVGMADAFNERQARLEQEFGD